MKHYSFCKRGYLLMKAQYKLTKQRKVILDELKKMEGHPTAEDIFETVKKLQPNIGLCTVYRNLDRFTELGLIKEIDGKLRRFCMKQEPHHHIRCMKCGKVEDLNHQVHIPSELIAGHGFSNKEVTLDVTGICQECSVSAEVEVKQTETHPGPIQLN